MPEFSLKARITATDEASGTVRKVEGRFRSFVDFLSARFVVTLGDVAQLVRATVDVFASFITAANAQETAVRQLDTALASLGPTASAVSAALQEQAAALQGVTQFGDEAIIQAQAFLATLGVQADKIPLATQATVDLASALNISLEAAARNVGRTVGGLAGELGEVIPELRDLSVEALKAGEGIELLATRFAGTASANVQTFQGRVAQLSNAFGDLKERLGAAVTENDAVVDSIGELSSTLSSAQTVELVQGLADGIAATATAALNAAAALPEATRTARDFAAGLQEVADGFLAADESGVLDAALAGLADKFEQIDALLKAGDAGLAAYLGNIVDLGAATRETNAALEAAAEVELVLALRREFGLTQAEALAAVGRQLVDSTNAEAGAARAAAGALGDLASATGAAADATTKLDGAATKTKSALEGLGSALGVITSAELAREIAEIEAALAASREEIGANSDEYVRLEQIATAKIAGLRDRILELKDGTGLLAEETRAAGEAFSQYTGAADSAAAATDRVTVANDRSVASFERQQQAAAAASSTLGGGGANVGTTSFDFAGGRFTFIDGRRVKVLPDGRIEVA